MYLRFVLSEKGVFMEVFNLSSEDIMTATEKTFTFLSDNKVDRKEALRLKLAEEDILLTYRQRLGEEAKLELYLEKRMGRPRVILRVAGVSCDPFAELSEEDWLMHNLMEKMGNEPVWNYRRSCNEVTFIAGKKRSMSSVAKILTAIVLGIGLGMLCKLLPGTLAHDISETWLAPVQNAIMGLLGCLSAFFILFSVTNGICSMGDVSTFNRVGRSLIFRLLIALMIDVIITAVFLPFFFSLSGGVAGGADFSTLWQMLVDIIPTNIVESFATGNTMQIVFLAMFASVMLLMMGPKAHQLVEIIDQLAGLLQQLIQYVIELMPVVVFISLFRLNADGDFSQLASAYKYPLLLLLFCAVYLIARVTVTSMRHRISPRQLIKKLLPTYLITLSTASSTASIPDNIDACENKLGIDRQIVNVGIPLGQTVYMPGIAMTLLIGVLCSAQVFDVPISFPSYLILVVSAYILSIATPPLPGAMLASFTLLMTQMGIPSDAMVIILALDPIIDRIATSSYVVGLQLKLIDIASALGMIDNEKLHSDAEK